MPKLPSYPVPALEKGLDILETLAAASVPQSLGELAVSLDRSSSELFRMLNCLEQRGYITREPVSGKYALTLKLFTLAHGHSVVEKLLRAAHVPMQRLSEKLRESVHMSVLDSGQLLVVAQEESPERVRLSIEVGGVFDPVATASGRLLLAHVSEEVRENSCASSPAWKALSARARATFQESLDEIRVTGTSFAESESIEGVRDVAVLVGDPACGVVAALAITRLLRRGQRGDESTMLAAMRGAAREITVSLGWKERAA